VLAFISNHHVGPGLEVEQFMLAPHREAAAASPPRLYKGFTHRGDERW